MPEQQKQMVLTVLQGIADYFKENPHDASQAEDMWASEGNSIAVIEAMIQGRCKEKAADGEVSRFEPFNCDGGAANLRNIILSFREDEEVGAMLSAFHKHKRK